MPVDPVPGRLRQEDHEFEIVGQLEFLWEALSQTNQPTNQSLLSKSDPCYPQTKQLYFAFMYIVCYLEGQSQPPPPRHVRESNPGPREDQASSGF